MKKVSESEKRNSRNQAVAQSRIRADFTVKDALDIAQATSTAHPEFAPQDILKAAHVARLLNDDQTGRWMPYIGSIPLAELLAAEAARTSGEMPGVTGLPKPMSPTMAAIWQQAEAINTAVDKASGLLLILGEWVGDAVLESAPHEKNKGASLHHLSCDVHDELEAALAALWQAVEAQRREAGTAAA